MILNEKNSKIVELISYGNISESDKLRNSYFNWLEDLSVTNLISSLDLIIPKRKKFIDDSFDRFTQKNTIGFFIKYLPDDIVLGTTKLDQISFFKRNAMDGIMIGCTNYHGKGIGYQTYRILLAYAFNILGLERIYGGCNEHNTAMIKIYEKLGYIREGILRKNDYINGKYSNHLLFGILRDEFLHLNKIELGYNK